MPNPEDTLNPKGKNTRNYVDKQSEKVRKDAEWDRQQREYEEMDRNMEKGLEWHKKNRLK